MKGQMKKQTKIFYFSGTGNTLASAKQIAAALGDTAVISIARVMEKSGPDKRAPIAIESDSVIIMYPAYGYGAPAMVRAFLKRADVRCEYLAVLVLYASKAGGAPAAAKNLLKKRKIKVNYFGRIRSVENYIPMFGAPKDEKVGPRVALQKTETARVADDIRARKTNKVLGFRPFAAFINLLFRGGRHLFVKSYRVLPSCTGCGVCANICPTGCIKIENGRAKVTKNCEHCQACLNFCPHKAIRYRNMKPHTKRYHHPDIVAGEINK
jgi:ferredoxin